MFAQTLGFRRAALLTLILVCALSIVAGKPDICWLPARLEPIDKSTLEDSWIGYDEFGSYHNLILASKGTGILYLRYLNGTYATNRIVSWDVREGTLNCVFARGNAKGDPSLLTCTIRWSSLKGELEAIGGGSDNIEFRRIKFVKESLAAFESFHP